MKKLIIILLCLSMSYSVNAQNSENGFENNVNSLISLASKGDVSALYELGELYYKYGNNLSSALSYLQRAALKGHEGARKRMKEIIDKTTCQAENGDINAQEELGWSYLRLYNDQFDFGDLYKDSKYRKKALYWLSKVASNSDTETKEKIFGLKQIALKFAKKGDVLAMFCMGKNLEGALYSYGRDKHDAIYWYNKAAQKGFAPAMYKLGSYWYRVLMGYYVNTEDRLRVMMVKPFAYTIEWWQKAAEQNDVNSIFGMGCINLIMKDGDSAISWFEKSATFGHIDSQWNLGLMYSEGECVEKNLSKAIYWWDKAGKLDDARSQLSLGDIFYNGEGVEQDFKKAYYWYEKCSKLESVNISSIKGQCSDLAKGRLGLLYYYGKGTEKDTCKAFNLLLEASKSAVSNGEVYRVLAACYRYGIGTDINQEKADYWFNKAVSSKDEKALSVLEELRKESGLSSKENSSDKVSGVVKGKDRRYLDYVIPQ